MFKAIVRLFSANTGASASAASNWAPKKRVSRPTMEKIRVLAATQPEVYNAVSLSKEFKLSVEGIQRILKSKYVPQAKDAERQEKNRYEAMGQRRKEFKKMHNIPEENPKKFVNKKMTEKAQEISTKREKRNDNANWSNTMYKKNHNFKDKSSARFSNEEGRYDDQRGFNKRADDGNILQRNFYRNSNDTSNFKTFRSNERKPFSSDDQEKRPFNRFNDKKPFVSRDNFNNDQDKRSFSRQNRGDNRNNNDRKPFISRDNFNKGQDKRPFSHQNRGDNRNYNDKRK